MARKSRKSNKVSVADVVSAAEHRKELAGIYTRLSVEDNGCGKKDSIQNQIAYLKEYVDRQDELNLMKVYIDNGTTGTNFERENWNQMIADIKEKRITCVVVKDFSRMGRNYIEVGNYLEKIFPFLGVRVISVNDNFDSKKDDFQNSMLMNSLTNIVNEYYARDISKKITQTKKTMQRKGEFASSVIPYGYKRSETDRKKLVVDIDSAYVVKKIFQWRVQEKGCVQIANYLNELAIPSPGKYRYMNGCANFKRSENAKWKSKHVAGILVNPVYLGHMVQGKTRCSYFENEGRLRFLPKEDWIIVENTHEPIVTQKEFDFAERLAEKSRKRYWEIQNANKDIPHVDNPLRNRVYCEQCGRLMTRKSKVQSGVRDYVYFCTSSQNVLDAHCTNTHIHEIPLMEAIRKATDQQLRLFGIRQSQWEKQESSDSSSESSWMEQKKKLEEHISLLKTQKQRLYIDMREEKISLRRFEEERTRLKEQQCECQEQIKIALDGEEMKKRTEKAIEKYRGEIIKIQESELPLELLDILITKIVVHSPEKIEISFNFTDILRREGKSFE